VLGTDFALIWSEKIVLNSRFFANSENNTGFLGYRRLFAQHRPAALQG
jgi:hypothetical protein